ncbi:MAG: diguanylate cyclase [Halopseudomonas sp.]
MNSDSSTSKSGRDKTVFLAFVSAIALTELTIMLLIRLLSLDAYGNWLPAIFDAASVSLVAVITFSYFVGRYQGLSGFGLLSYGIQLKVGAIVFGVEILVMSILPLLSLGHSQWYGALLDTVVLAAVGGSIIYWKLFLPNIRHKVISVVGAPVSLFWGALYTYLTLMSFVSIIFFSIYEQQQQQFWEELGWEESVKLGTLEHELLIEQRQAALDISLLARQTNLKAYRAGELSLEKQLNVDYSSFLDVMDSYDQLRFIDSQGVEKIRADRHQGLPRSVPAEQLQSKQHRSYFNKAMQLSQGEIYISELDLNMEYGEVSTPYRPVLRLATPFFNDRGDKDGLVIINLAAQQMLSHLVKPVQPLQGQLALLQEDGFWLYGVEEQRRWGNLFAGRRQHNFVLNQPDVWRQMQPLAQGSTKTDQGLYVYRKVTPLNYPDLTKMLASDTTLQPPHWWLVSFIGADVLSAALSQLRSILLGLWLFFAVISAVVTALFSRTFKQRIDADIKLQRLAHFDFLTQVANRALFAELLNQELYRSQRSGTASALLYMDLDDFKPINDELGHDAGDDALKEVARRLNQQVRPYDTVARLGGDEFAILMPGPVSAEDAEKMAGRIVELFNAPFLIGCEQRQIGISIGIALLPNGFSNDQQAIDAADGAMYSAKQAGKNRFCRVPSAV